MKKMTLLGVGLVLLVVFGCAHEPIYHSRPAMGTVSADLFGVQLEPLKAEGYNYYNTFRFVFTNKSGQDLIIDWSDTYYLQNQRRHGHFGWKGLTFEHLKELKKEPDLTVSAGKTVSVVIFPLKLIGWKEEGVRKKNQSIEAGFTNGIIPAGQNGMSLAIRQGGKLLRKDILVTITLD